jgi:hypothetical protein
MSTALEIFSAHGLRCNDSKTQGPVQRITFLGLGLDSVQQVLFVPEDKVDDLQAGIGRMLARTHTTKWGLQSLVGKMSFVAKALPGARPFFRSLIDATKGLPHPYARQKLSDAMREDLVLWLRFIKNWNGRARWRRADPIAITHDASRDGFGFYLARLPDGFNPSRLPQRLRLGSAFAGSFSQEHMQHNDRSIQYGELLAIAVSVAMYAPYLRNQSLLVLSDNETDVHVINRQRTASPPLLTLLRAVYRVCAEYNIDIRARHLPGENNYVADLLSRPNLHMFRSHTPPHAQHGMFHITYIHSSSLAMTDCPSFVWNV